MAWMRAIVSEIVTVPGSRQNREGLLMDREESVRDIKGTRKNRNFLTEATEQKQIDHLVLRNSAYRVRRAGNDCSLKFLFSFRFQGGNKCICGAGVWCTPAVEECCLTWRDT